MINPAAVQAQLTTGDLIEVVFETPCQCDDFHRLDEVIGHLNDDVFETHVQGTFVAVANNALAVATRLEAKEGVTPKFGGVLRIPFVAITGIRSLIVGWEIGASVEAAHGE